jgi:nicotinate-nucleotide adenylyltransferase
VQFFQRSRARTKRLGVLPGGFNPPTIAHLALAEAARSHVDEVLCVLPRAFPHKEYFGATIEQRIAMLESLHLAIPRSIAISEQGLFIDIAQECRAEFGPEVELCFLCGRDAADRILTWDYGRPGVVERMLQEFELLVASRGGEFQPPANFRHRIHALDMPAGHDLISSTEVRERIARGETWEHLVPQRIVERVREIYS